MFPRGSFNARAGKKNRVLRVKQNRECRRRGEAVGKRGTWKMEETVDSTIWEMKCYGIGKV